MEKKTTEVIIQSCMLLTSAYKTALPRRLGKSHLDTITLPGEVCD